MNVLWKVNLPHKAGVVFAILAVAIAAALIITATLNQSQRVSAQADPLPPTLDPPELDTEDDTGAADDDNITNQTMGLTFTGDDALMTSAAVTVIVTATLNSVVTSATVTADAGGNYSADLTLVTNGVWQVDAVQVAGDLTSTRSTVLSVTIDTEGPGVKDVIDRTIILGDDPSYPGTQFFANESGLSYDATSADTSVAGASVSGSNVTITSNAPGTAAITVTATDRAGNESERNFNAKVYPPPLLPPDLDDDDDIGLSNGDDITNKTALTFTGSSTVQNAMVAITATEKIISGNPIGEAVGDGLSLSTDVRITSVLVVISSSGSIERHVPTSHLFGQTVTGDNLVLDGINPVGSQRGTFTINGGRTIVVQNDADGELTATATLSDGTSQTIIIYTEVASQAPTTVVAGAVRGTSVEASVMQETNGDYSADLDLTLASATLTSPVVWRVTASQTSAALQSPESATDITIETTPPMSEGSIPAQTLDLNGSGEIEDVTRFFSSTAGDPLTYSVGAIDGTDDSDIGATVDSDDDLNITAGDTAGRATVTIIASDVAGNEAMQTVAVSVRLGLPDLHDDDDTGSSNSDNITNKDSFRISGTGATPNGRVQVKVRGSDSSSGPFTTANAAGEYTYTTESLGEGTWGFSVNQELGGSRLPDSEELEVTVDTTRPRFELLGALHDAVIDGFLNAAENNTYGGADLLAASDWSIAVSTDTVTHSVIGRNANDDPVVCNGTDATQDRTPSAVAVINETDLLIEDIRYEPNDDFDFGVHYICATATDIAGNVSYSDPVGPIVRDTTIPTFQANRPAPMGDAFDALIEWSERGATNIINVGNTHANDLIAFAVQSTNTACNANDFPAATSATQAQFHAANLTSEGNNFICVRLTDEAGNAPSSGVFASTSITRNIVRPSIAEDIPNQTLNTGQTLTLGALRYFDDTNDTLTITARSRNTNVVDVEVDSDDITLEAVAVGVGPVTITVTATDTAGQRITQTFTVTVTSEFNLEFPEPPSGSPIHHFIVAEVPEDAPDAPTVTPRAVRFPASLYNITPRDSAGNPLSGVAAEVCLSVENLGRPGRFAVYHYNDVDEVWERLPSYISDDGTHVCAETQAFSIFTLGFVVAEIASAGPLPPTGGVIPSTWFIAAAAVGGLMTLVAGAALGLTALSRRTTRKNSLQEQRPIT